MKGFDFAAGLSNPAYIAGISGLNPLAGKQLVQQAALQREQKQENRAEEKHNFEKTKLLREEEAAKAMLQQFGDVDFDNPTKALQQLQDKKVPADAALLLIHKHNEIKNSKENVDINRGRLGVEQAGLGLQQQRLDVDRQDLAQKAAERAAKPKMTVQEQIANNKILGEGRKGAETAKGTLKSLRSLDDAFDKFDKAGSRGNAGSFLHGDFAKSLGSEYILTPERRAQGQIIGKAKGELAKKLLAGGLGSALGGKSEAEVLKAIPDEKLLPEARNTVLKQLATTESTAVAKNVFNETWRQINHGDMNGSDIVFNEIMEKAGLLDEKGYLIKGAENKIAAILREYASNSGE